MTEDKFKLYQSPGEDLPEKTVSWNMYGPGVENIGKEGQPEVFSVSEPGPDQLLVRVDSVGMCFSDVKLITQGGAHPKLYNRDLAKEPTRLGHEAALTVLKVGENLSDQYTPGQRLAIQPDIYQDGISTAYGYTIPGGLTQFHLIGPEVLDADDGAYVLPVEMKLGYAETALTEPWACVEAAYTQRRRLDIKRGGTLWILGHSEDTREYEFSVGLEAPRLIVLSDVPESVKRLVDLQKERGATIKEWNELSTADFEKLKSEVTYNQGFDDIVMLDPRSADRVTEAAKLIAFRGTFNLVGQSPLDGKPQIDIGRIHYHYTAYVGTRGPDISASYGEARNRADLHPGGTAVFVGAGGPMGQMHVQRAIELEEGPKLIVATEVNEHRLEVLGERFGPLAEQLGKRLVTANPMTMETTLDDLLKELGVEQGADDVVVSVPHAGIIQDSALLLAPDGMLNLFAGVPNGTFAPLDVSSVYLHNMQLTGTSGSKLADQQRVLDKAVSGQLSPNRSVAAVGGIEAARDGVEAMMEGTYAGKVVIFPQINDLPLMGLAELVEKYPELAEELGEDLVWTPKAERILIDLLWQGPNGQSD
jgi:threonine dehydrogenase-like Zn-dependent dehydrogenase